MTTEVKPNLRTLAERATPGPWRSAWAEQGKREDDAAIVGPDDKPVVSCVQYDGIWAACSEPNSAYIAAASPSVAIELGALVDALTDGRGVYADKESALITRCRELFGRQ